MQEEECYVVQRFEQRSPEAAYSQLDVPNWLPGGLRKEPHGMASVHTCPPAPLRAPDCANRLCYEPVHLN